MSDYVFDNKEAETEQRFGALEALFDPLSKRHLEPFVTPGTHCLEVGGGSGSIALWMAERSGARGRVLVTDINTRFLDGIAGPNIDVRQHDIVSDPLPEGAFDVAHTRLVLGHLPERKRAVERIVAALKPGGWVVFQEFDSQSLPTDAAKVPTEHLLKSVNVMWGLMTERGVNLNFGRELYPLLTSLGLREVESEGHVTVWHGKSTGARLLRANFDQMHDQLIATGRLTEQEFAADVARLDDPATTWPSPIMWTARARKPS